MSSAGSVSDPSSAITTTTTITTTSSSSRNPSDSAVFQQWRRDKLEQWKNGSEQLRLKFKTQADLEAYLQKKGAEAYAITKAQRERQQAAIGTSFTHGDHGAGAFADGRRTSGDALGVMGMGLGRSVLVGIVAIIVLVTVLAGLATVATSWSSSSSSSSSPSSRAAASFVRRDEREWKECWMTDGFLCFP